LKLESMIISATKKKREGKRCELSPEIKPMANQQGGKRKLNASRKNA